MDTEFKFLRGLIHKVALRALVPTELNQLEAAERDFVQSLSRLIFLYIEDQRNALSSKFVDALRNIRP